MTNRVVIMLDVDGVLTSFRVSAACGDVGTIGVFDPVAVTFFNRMVAQYNPYFVVASSWRTFHTKQDLCSIFKAAGLSSVVKNLHNDWCTPTTKSNSREDEIEQWLQANMCDKFIVVDDANMNHKYLKDRHVRPSEKNGLLLYHYNQIEELLENLTNE